MTELIQPGIDGKPLGFVDEDGDVLPYENLGEVEDPQLRDTTVEDPPHHDRWESTPISYPESVQQHRARIIRNDIARQSYKLTAQEELGGGIRQHDELNDQPIDEAIRGSEDWHMELRDAVERFGMNEIDIEAYAAMSETQKEQFSLHFKEFFDTVRGRPDFIESREGVIAHDSRLGDWYGAERTPEELLDYSKRLRLLLALLDETGIPKKVSEYLHTRRRSKRLPRKIDYRDYQLIFKSKKDGTKKPYRQSE